MARLAVLLKGYPRLSETFIAQEILALQQRGFDLRLISLRRPTDKKSHPIHQSITAPVTYLPEYLHETPLQLLRAWWRQRRRPGYAAARSAFLADLRRDFTRNRVRRFGQALFLADLLTPQDQALYAHFMHTPGSVARYTALLTGLPYALSAHAKDIWTTPDWEKRDKLTDCRFLVTCTASGAEHLTALAPPDTVTLVYHGLDLSRFPPPPARRPAHDGKGDPVLILSVGRLVEKKGTDDLLRALALLPPDLNWQFEHIGGGDRTPYIALTEELGLTDKVRWHGPADQPLVIEALRRADIFALASRIGGDGDRDGLPNVLMEAASQGLPAVSTAISAIPEFIINGQTGLLVPERTPDAFAAALKQLIADPAARHRMGTAAHARLTADFGSEAGISRLSALLEERLFLRPAP
jgi:glycosyltransferase involved in cell wall biosynthesis